MATRTKNNFGFTLIELLVVISVIGFLSTLALVNLKNARMRARDAQRITGIKQLERAILFYYDDNFHYPAVNAASTSSDADGCGTSGRWCTLETALALYMPTGIPRDPLGLQDNYRYYYDSDSGDSNQTYGLMVRFESLANDGLVNNDGGFYSDGGTYYEMGAQPPYCSGKYAGNWWGAQTTVCLDGD